MLARLAIVLVAAGLIAAGWSPPQARAADPIIAHDTLITWIGALDGDLVYLRAGNPYPKRVWMARFQGHLQQARGIPETRGAVHGGDIGRDAKGRKVFTFAVGHRNKFGTTVSTKWFVY